MSCNQSGNHTDISIQAARDAQLARVTNSDPPQVERVSLSWAKTGNEYLVQPGKPGNGAVTKSGKTYKITGNIQPMSWTPGGDPNSGNRPSGSPAPFEFDATCP
ncbi:MAG: 19 kDa lipoprotein antigen [Mycobacterium sp.]|nr:19 kDa lipoprotein antigen [Mycobacterium sp.]